MTERQQIVVVAQESLHTTRDFFEDVPGPVALGVSLHHRSAADNTPISFTHHAAELFSPTPSGVYIIH